MTAVLTAAEMRALEHAAIASGEVTGLELMERAGRGVVEAILAEWPGIEEGARRAVVLSGPGNNGGDGFVVARLLRERGWGVEVFLYGDAETLPPNARVNHQRWLERSPVHDLAHEPEVERIAHRSTGVDLVIDALFGIGLARPLDGALAHALDRLASTFPTAAAKWVAVDVVSGLCSDSGRVLCPPDTEWEPNDFDLLVTFHRAKVGHYLGSYSPSRAYIVDIGLVLKPRRPNLSDLAAGLSAELAEQNRRKEVGLPRSTREEVAAMTTLAGRMFPDSIANTERLEGPTEPLNKAETPRGHKYSHGHAVILSGGVGKGGAARLSARGALRIGAGLVTLAVPPAALQENAAALNAVMLRSVKDSGALAEYLADDRLNALCAGPGLGLAEAQGALVAAVLGLRRPTVLDADALTLVSKDDSLRARLHDRVVITPHEGEFARLFPEIDAKWRAPATTGPAFSKVDAAREAARAAGCVVLLKGPDTVIADPSGRGAINAAVYDRAAPWLATAGTGDVLAGFITGLLARGFDPFDAACTAAWLHVECARSFGPGLIAEDLPEELPKVFRALGL